MAGPTRTIIDDTFENDVVDLSISSGNGTITETGGQLVVTAPTGVNCDWYTFGRNGKIAYTPLNYTAKDRIVTITTEVGAFSNANPSYGHSLWGLYQDDYNHYWIYSHDGINWHAHKVVGNSWTYIAAYSGNPVTLPIKLRFVWDRIDNSIKWQIDSGSGFVTIATQTLGITPSRVFFACKNWSSLPQIQVKYNYVLATAEQFDLSLAERVAGVLDAGQVKHAGGPPAHSLVDVGTGQLVPGPIAQSVGSVGPFDVGSVQDRVTATITNLVEQNVLKNRVDQVGLKDVGTAQDLRPYISGSSSPNTYWKPKQQTAPEDAVIARLGSVVQFNPYTPTYDNEGHQHLLDYRVYILTVGNTNSEPWAQPTANNFSGFGRDGKKYTNGVLDPGPVWASWATETAGVNRSSRTRFPSFYAIAVSLSELIIYDLDNFPTTLDVWMRFRLANDGTNFLALGRGYGSLQDVEMKNGVLYVIAKYTGWEPGRLHIIDFKLDGQQDSWQLVGSDGHWRLNPGRNLTYRNTTPNQWVSTGSAIRLSSDNNYSLAVSADESDPLWQRVWVVVGGDDNFSVIEILNNIPQFDYSMVPTPAGNLGNVRSVAIGHDGVLWLMHYDSTNDLTYVWRNGFDYRGGVITHPWAGRDGIETDGGRKGRWLGFIMRGALGRGSSLASARNYLYIGTDKGVYQVHKVSLVRTLAFTIAGGGGGGPFNSPPAGEVLVGGQAGVKRLRIQNAQKASYLSVASAGSMDGGVTVVRLYDGWMVHSRVYSSLNEDAAYAMAAIPTP